MVISYNFYFEHKPYCWMSSSVKKMKMMISFIIQALVLLVLDAHALGDVETKFFLYTRSNLQEPYELKYDDASNLNGSPFDPNIPTKILIHGINNNCNSEFVQLIKNAYLKSREINVICCSHGEETSSFLGNIIEKTEKLGQEVASMISSFVKKGGLDPKNIHILGHSLGAHIAGFAAQMLKSSFTIPRITGLDPAGPQFNSEGADKRLSGDDGEFVECIHTNSDVLSFASLCGSADFYVNGGGHQPQCSAEDSHRRGLEEYWMKGKKYVNTVLNKISCSHGAAYKYWAESIENKNAYPAKQCRTIEEASDVSNAPNNCVGGQAVMGDDAINRTPKGIYFVEVKTE